MPMPMMMPPFHWLSASLGLYSRPESSAETIRETRTVPKSSSTRTSTKCAHQLKREQLPSLCDIIPAIVVKFL